MNLGHPIRHLSRISVFLTICLLTPLARADWPAFRHDAERTGFTTETLPAKLSLQPAYDPKSERVKM